MSTLLRRFNLSAHIALLMAVIMSTFAVSAASASASAESILTINPGTTLSVYVFEKSSHVPGAAIPDAVVTLHNAAGTPFMKGTTDERGWLTVSVPAGSYELYVSRDGYKPA